MLASLPQVNMLAHSTLIQELIGQTEYKRFNYTDGVRRTMRRPGRL